MRERWSEWHEHNGLRSRIAYPPPPYRLVLLVLLGTILLALGFGLLLTTPQEPTVTAAEEAAWQAGFEAGVSAAENYLGDQCPRLGSS